MKRLAIVVSLLATVLEVFGTPTVSGVAAKVTGSNSSGKLQISYKLSDSSTRIDLDSRFVQARIFETKSGAQAWGDEIKRNYGSAVPCGSDDPFDMYLYDEDEVCNGTHSFTINMYNEYGISARDFRDDYPKAYIAVAVFDDANDTSAYQVSAVTYDMSFGSEYATLLYSKAQTLTGLCSSDEDSGYYGTVSLKLGKINAKTGVVKVSATITPFVGSKKFTASANMTADEDGGIYDILKFKTPIGDMELAIGGEVYEDERGRNAFEFWFEGSSDGGYVIYSADVGGAFDTDLLTCYADMGCVDFDFGDCWYIIATLEEAPIYVSRGTKWSFDKVPTLKYVRYHEDGDVWYELDGLDDEDKTNVSGLKLTYTSKTGVFKGSYYLYLSNEECQDYGSKPTLKKIKVTVSGIVVDGYGIGSASAKFGSENYSWPIYIEGGCPDCYEVNAVGL